MIKQPAVFITNVDIGKPEGGVCIAALIRYRKLAPKPPPRKMKSNLFNSFIERIVEMFP